MTNAKRSLTDEEVVIGATVMVKVPRKGLSGNVWLEAIVLDLAPMSFNTAWTPTKHQHRLVSLAVRDDGAAGGIGSEHWVPRRAKRMSLRRFNPEVAGRSL